MSVKTASEEAFEEFCVDVEIAWRCIPCQQTQTPDYELTFAEHLVVAEVKQIDPNREDKECFESVRTQGTVAAWAMSDRRIRKKIQHAASQLKARTNGAIPAIVVIYDNGTFGGVDSIDIKTAMYGDEKVVVSLIGNFATPIHAGAHRQMTPTCNTTVSAVALLYRAGASTRLDIFHNRFAASPIVADWLRHERVQHFALADDQYEWIPV